MAPSLCYFGLEPSPLVSVTRAHCHSKLPWDVLILRLRIFGVAF
jgi:hypothetical protein